MKGQPCRLCYGTRSRFVILDDPAPDGPYFVLTLCPCVTADLPVRVPQLDNETAGSPARRARDNVNPLGYRRSFDDAIRDE
jgi:hypothetical protein